MKMIFFLLNYAVTRYQVTLELMITFISFVQYFRKIIFDNFQEKKGRKDKLIIP